MKSETKDFILKFAKIVIKKYLDGVIVDIPEEYPEELKEKKGVFVTLTTKNNCLRGCIGIPYPVASAIENIRNAAISATRDPRFPPLALEELKEINVEVSILTKPELVKVKNPKKYLEKIRKNVDGVIIKKGFCEALFLPQVWEEVKDKVKFLENLCLKAGLEPNDWQSDDVKIYKFQVEIVDDKNKKGRKFKKL